MEHEQMTEEDARSWAADRFGSAARVATAPGLFLVGEDIDGTMLPHGQGATWAAAVADAEATIAAGEWADREADAQIGPPHQWPVDVRPDAAIGMVDTDLEHLRRAWAAIRCSAIESEIAKEDSEPDE
jgi:hypothetical protein